MLNQTLVTVKNGVDWIYIKEITNRIFYTLQKVHEQIILKKGGGDFKPLHMKKERIILLRMIQTIRIMKELF